MMACRRFVLLPVAVCALAAAARGDVTSINSLDVGWYEDTGLHIVGNQNYCVGEDVDAGVQSLTRNWFVFNVPSGPAITGARLRLYNPSTPQYAGYYSADPTETYALFDVTTPVPTLRAQGGVAAYNDVGTGITYGNVTVSLADNGKFVTVDMNADGLAALNAARGGQFAVGGSLITQDDSVHRAEYVFGYTPAVAVPGNTVLDIVPEPGSTGAVMIAGAAALLRRSRRR